MGTLTALRLVRAAALVATMQAKAPALPPMAMDENFVGPFIVLTAKVASLLLLYTICMAEARAMDERTPFALLVGNMHLFKDRATAHLLPRIQTAVRFWVTRTPVTKFPLESTAWNDLGRPWTPPCANDTTTKNTRTPATGNGLGWPVVMDEKGTWRELGIAFVVASFSKAVVIRYRRNVGKV